MKRYFFRNLEEFVLIETFAPFSKKVEFFEKKRRRRSIFFFKLVQNVKVFGAALFGPHDIFPNDKVD